jgi:hypothetical protein
LLGISAALAHPPRKHAGEEPWEFSLRTLRFVKLTTTGTLAPTGASRNASVVSPREAALGHASAPPLAPRLLSYPTQQLWTAANARSPGGNRKGLLMVHPELLPENPCG